MVSIALLRNPRSVVLPHLQRLEEQLQGQPFLFGAEPKHADFSTFHGLRFLRDLGESALAEGFASVNAWMDRLLAGMARTARSRAKKRYKSLQRPPRATSPPATAPIP
jgi:glutathione S-transferase